MRLDVRNIGWNAVAVLVFTALCAPSHAQPPPRRELLDRAEARGRGTTAFDRPMLRQRLGVDKAEALLISTAFHERLQGVDRLAALSARPGLGGEEAVMALASGMSPGSAVRTDARSRLAAVRALAPHAKEHEQARRVLVSVLNSVRAGLPETPLDVLSRATAALGLAKAGTEDALTPLLAAVIGRGRTGELARDALVTFPPDDLAPVVKNAKTMPVPLIALLGDLGDPRVLGVLRRQLQRKPLHVKRAAALALAKLGDGTAVPMARKWGEKKQDGESGEAEKSGTAEDAEDDDASDDPKAASKRNDPLQRVAGAEVLMWLGSPHAAGAIAQLLGDARTRAEGLRLAERSLSPALVPTLSAVVKAKVTPAERLRATAVLARVGGDSAAATLLSLLGKSELATLAAFGLANARGNAASTGLARALAGAAAGPPKRLILRAALMRQFEIGDAISGLSSSLEAAFGSTDPADRAIAAFGLALLGERSVGELARSKHPEVMMAAASASLALGPKAMAVFGKLLAKAPEEPDARTVAASVALLTGGHGVPTTRLLSWAEGGSSLAPLAAFQLARRDSKTYRKRLVRLLDGTDPIVRLHVALGLSESPEQNAVTLLVDAYRFESDVRVRRAIVRALSHRSEKRRLATLESAAAYDADAEVRGLAAAAHRGRKHPLTAVPRGRQMAWVSLRANSAEQQSAVALRPAMLVRDDGLVLPVVSPPDGVVLVPGVGDRHDVQLVVGVDDDL